MFPDIDVKQIKNKEEWDKLRNYVKIKTYPIWKIELDGTRIEITTNKMIKNENNTERDVVNVLKGRTTYAFGYSYEYASWEDVINYPIILPYRKKPNEIIKKLKLNVSKEIDFDLIRQYYPNNLIWKIDEEGNRVERYNSVIDAREKNGLGRETIESVIRGKCINTTNKKTGEKLIWEAATYYKNDTIKRYRKLSLKERYSKTRVKRKQIIQKTLDGKKIKIWKNRYEIYKELDIYVSMSYFTQNGYIFEYIN